MTNEERVLPLFKELHNKVLSEDFVVDKSGVKTVELIAPKILIDPTQKYMDFGAKKSNEDYIEKEHKWYMSKDLCITGYVDDVKIWDQVSDSNKEINSNYGYLVYGRGNFNQFDNALKNLKENRDSRQAVIYYARPSIHYEAKSFGASDFICTFFQHFFIRNNELICITAMRSCDSIFGFLNDSPWFSSVILNMHDKLLETYPDLKIGFNTFIPNSFHVYERHFPLLERIVNGSF